MRMFHADLSMFPSHLLPHHPTHIHQSRNPRKGGGAKRRRPFVEPARSAAPFMHGCVWAGEAADAMEPSINMHETCACMHITRNSYGYLANTYENIHWLNAFIHLYMLLYTSVYLHIPPNAFNIFPYTIIYIRIFDIRKMRTDRKHKNGHNSDPSAPPTPQIWLKPSYHAPRGSCAPKGPPN